MIGTVILEVGKQVLVALIVYAVQEFVSNTRYSKRMKNSKKNRNNKRKHRR